MKKKIIYSTIISLIVPNAIAQDLHVVQKGETLSEIVYKYFPNARIYGKNGKLKEILSRNKHITNPHSIHPNQKIQITENIARVLHESELSDKWDISIYYGAKYLSLSQSGALGRAELGVLFFNNLKFNSEFNIEDWGAEFQIDSYRFRYEAVSSKGSKQMSSLNLYGSYKWLLAGFNIEESPLFKKSGSNIEMTKMTVMNLVLGIKKSIDLPVEKPTTLNLKGMVSYPVWASDENTDIEVRSVSGFEAIGQAQLNRRLFEKENYSLNISWMTQIKFKKIDQDIKWSTTEGQSKTQISDISTALGLQISL